MWHFIVLKQFYIFEEKIFKTRIACLSENIIRLGFLKGKKVPDIYKLQSFSQTFVTNFIYYKITKK